MAYIFYYMAIIFSLVMLLFFDDDSIYYIIEISRQCFHKWIISNNFNKWKNVSQILGQTTFMPFRGRPPNSNIFHFLYQSYMSTKWTRVSPKVNSVICLLFQEYMYYIPNQNDITYWCCSNAAFRYGTIVVITPTFPYKKFGGKSRSIYVSQSVKFFPPSE